MAKRPYDDTDENSNYNPYDSEENGDNQNLQRAAILSQMSRILMGRYSRNLKIRREHIQAVLQKQNLKGNSRMWLSLLDNEMRETFGLKLEIHESEILVTSNLEAASKDILHSLWTSNPEYEKSTNLSYSGVLMSRNKRDFVLVNTIEQLQGGLIMIVVTLLVLSGNRINEPDLISALSNFGFSENLNLSMPVLNKNTPNILSELTRKEYLKKVLPHGDTGVGAEYSLGKRALRELHPPDILNFLLEVVDSEDGQRKAKTAIMRCFPEFRTANTKSGASSELADAA